MAETFTRFDAADYLTTDEGVAAFLDAAAEGNDPAHLAQALATVARAQNMSKLARDTGITREGLYKALAPDGNPAFATIVRIAGALGLRVAFVPDEVKDKGQMPLPSVDMMDVKQVERVMPINGSSPTRILKRKRTMTQKPETAADTAPNAGNTLLRKERRSPRHG